MAETYYSMTELVKLTDNLIAAMPTSFYSGIMAVRGGLATAPTADVVARDCYDRLLAENDELRKERPVIRCGECKYRQYDALFHQSYCNGNRVTDDWYCADGERSTNCGALMDKDGDGDV